MLIASGYGGDVCDAESTPSTFKLPVERLTIVNLKEGLLSTRAYINIQKKAPGALMEPEKL